jgi:hypothetical protein
MPALGSSNGENDHPPLASPTARLPIEAAHHGINTSSDGLPGPLGSLWDDLPM